MCRVSVFVLKEERFMLFCWGFLFLVFLGLKGLLFFVCFHFFRVKWGVLIFRCWFLTVFFFFLGGGEWVGFMGVRIVVWCLWVGFTISEISLGEQRMIRLI